MKIRHTRWILVFLLKLAALLVQMQAFKKLGNLKADSFKFNTCVSVPQKKNTAFPSHQVI